MLASDAAGVKATTRSPTLSFGEPGRDRDAPGNQGDRAEYYF
jgi:hypothetical protein